MRTSTFEATIESHILSLVRFSALDRRLVALQETRKSRSCEVIALKLGLALYNLKKVVHISLEPDERTTRSTGALRS